MAMYEDDFPGKPIDIRVVVPPELGGVTIGDALGLIAAISPAQARSIVEFGSVKVNGKCRRDPSAPLPRSARLTVAWRPVPGAPDAPLAVLLEDEDLLVVDKPAGRPVQATRLGRGNSIVEELAAKAAGAWIPRAVHRLDLPVSGLLAVAKSKAGAAALSRLIQRGHVNKAYLALVHPGERGRKFLRGASLHPRAIDAPLKWLSGPQRALVAPEGKPCLSLVLDAGDWEGARAVAVALRTGRTHQIRAHLAHAGMPVAGDRAYGGVDGAGRGRIALHSVFLALPHPISGRPLEFLQPPPPGFWQEAGCRAPGRLPEQLVAALRRVGV